jgi:tRNA pseudouridine38-40 synthase
VSSVCGDQPAGLEQNGQVQAHEGGQPNEDGSSDQPYGAVPEGGLRLRLDLGYDGTAFSGWAAQPGQRTVEGTLAAALATLLRQPDPPRLGVAGRTDAGVHARGQVAHVDLGPAAYQAFEALARPHRSAHEALRVRLAGLLPHDVVVHRVCRAAPGFDARFSAIHRRYLYRIADGAAQRDPLRRHDTLWLSERFDVAALHEASARLVGLRDFAAFCKRREGATTVRTLIEFGWQREADGVLVGRVVADAFCHSMVRALVGAVLPVGQGRVPIDWPAHVQAAAVRNPRVRVMPPHGLSLQEVGYPPDDELAQRSSAARARRTIAP